MAKRLITLSVGIIAGMVIHHYVIEKSGNHNAFDRAVDRGEQKLRTTTRQVAHADDPAGEVRKQVAGAADAVAEKVSEAADQVSDTADKVADGAQRAAAKTQETAAKVSDETADKTAKAKERVLADE